MTEQETNEMRAVIAYWRDAAQRYRRHYVGLATAVAKALGVDVNPTPEAIKAPETLAEELAQEIKSMQKTLKDVTTALNDVQRELNATRADEERPARVWPEAFYASECEGSSDYLYPINRYETVEALAEAEGIEPGVAFDAYLFERVTAIVPLEEFAEDVITANETDDVLPLSRGEAWETFILEALEPAVDKLAALPFYRRVAVTVTAAHPVSDNQIEMPF